MNQHPVTTGGAQPKRHFEILDGMRGVAGLGVVVFHFMEWVQGDYTKSFIGHGFMAVDFFFCLSGFVIGYAYDERIKTIGLAKFFKSRLIRLHPLVLFGSLFGLIFFLLNPFGAAPTAYSAGRILIITLCSVFLIPFSVMDDRANNQFGLNAPAWSLFWEYVANIVYGFVLVRINRVALVIITVLAAIVLAYVGWKAGNLLGGWGKGNFWDGGARVAFSFSAGLLIYRFKWIIKNKLGFALLSLLLLATMFMHYGNWEWVGQFLVIVLYFPLLISLGAGSTAPKKLAAICRFSGRISYPLYMTHYAGIWIFGNYITTHKLSDWQLALIITGGTIIMLLFAWAVMVLYDEPVRKWLTKKTV